MFETTRPVPPPKILRYIALYILYALIVAMAYVVVVQIWPSTVLAMIGAFLGRTAANRITYMLSMILIGSVMFVAVLAAEPYLRRGMEQRRLLWRFARIAVPIGLFGLLGWLLWRIALMLLV